MFSHFVHVLFQVLHLHTCNVCLYVCVCGGGGPAVCGCMCMLEKKKGGGSVCVSGCMLRFVKTFF